MTPERIAELRAEVETPAAGETFDCPIDADECMSITWGELRTLLDYYSDSPDLDGTDGAHPAWWRGEEYGVLSAVREVNKWLDGDSLGGTYREPVQSLRSRVVNLRGMASRYVELKK